MRTTTTRRERGVVAGLALATIITGSAATVASATTTSPAPGNAALAAPAAPQDGHNGSVDGPASPQRGTPAAQTGDIGTLAAARNCVYGIDLCLWWDQNFERNSATGGFGGHDFDHMAWTFPRNGRGGGSRIGNNAASFLNTDLRNPVTVFYNPSRDHRRPPGPSQYYAPGQGRNCAQAGPLICNNNRSHFWF